MAYAVRSTEPTSDGRELVHYDGGASKLKVLVTRDESDSLSHVEVFFWDGPEDGPGRRDRVANVYVSQAFGPRGTKKVEFGGPSFSAATPEEASDYVAALAVAQAWFELASAEARLPAAAAGA